MAGIKLRKGLTKSCGCVKNPGGTGGKKIDRTGMRIGKLVILEPTEKRTASREVIWLAKCDCGNICEIRGDDIRNGSKKSCGCSKYNDIKKALQNHTHLEGKRFGKLIVIQRDFESGEWLCQCDCGRQTSLTTYELTRENATGSCGHCNYSIGEYKIATLLTEHQLEFETQKIFETCVNPDTNRHLKFDFYVDNKYLIEFDGEQHFNARNSGWSTID